MSDLELQLLQAMIKIRVRFQDGLSRIQNCLSLVEEVGVEMENDLKWAKIWKALQNKNENPSNETH